MREFSKEALSNEARVLGAINLRFTQLDARVAEATRAAEPDEP